MTLQQKGRYYDFFVTLVTDYRIHCDLFPELTRKAESPVIKSHPLIYFLQLSINLKRLQVESGRNGKWGSQVTVSSWMLDP